VAGCVALYKAHRLENCVGCSLMRKVAKRIFESMPVEVVMPKQHYFGKLGSTVVGVGYNSVAVHDCQRARCLNMNKE